MERQKQIIAITGYSAAGKSSLARSISDSLDMGLFGLGNHQRASFGAYGTPQEYHARLGLFTTYYGRWPEYIAEISKNRFRSGIVVEGIYSPAFLELMKREFSNYKIYLMEISAKRDDRIWFLRIKTGLS